MSPQSGRASDSRLSTSFEAELARPFAAPADSLALASGLGVGDASRFRTPKA